MYKEASGCEDNSTGEAIIHKTSTTSSFVPVTPTLPKLAVVDILQLDMEQRIRREGNRRTICPATSVLPRLPSIHKRRRTTPEYRHSMLTPSPPIQMMHANQATMDVLDEVMHIARGLTTTSAYLPSPMVSLDTDVHPTGLRHGDLESDIDC